MKRLLIILLSLPLFVHAQEITTLELPKQIKHEISFNSNLLFESSSLDKSFLNTMLYGGYITDTMKSKWINAGGNNNIIYTEISNSIAYNYHFKNQSIGFSFADRNILNASFTDDLLRLGFEGNFHHQDKTLDFGGTSIRADRFQQYKLSYAYKGVKAGLSFLAGNHHLSYIVEKGSLYTAPFGTSLDIAYDMNAFVTDTSTANPFANNGNGMALDLSTDFSINAYDIHLSLTDLGFIMWNPSSITLATDSNFSFSGIEVEDAFNFNDSLIEISTPEDILKTNNNAFKSYIPATFHVSISGDVEHECFTTFRAGIVAKWQPHQDNMLLSFAKIGQGFRESNFSPLFYLKTQAIMKYGTILPSISYGGYTADFNLGLAYSVGKKHKFILGSHHIEDILNGDKTKAVSLYLTLSTQF